MFRTVPLSIIRSFSLYTQQWYMSYRLADSLRAGSGQNCSFPLIRRLGGLHIRYGRLEEKSLPPAGSQTTFCRLSSLQASHYTN